MILRSVIEDCLYYRRRREGKDCEAQCHWVLENVRLAMTGSGPDDDPLVIDDYAAVAAGDGRLATVLRRARP